VLAPPHHGTRCQSLLRVLLDFWCMRRVGVPPDACRRPAAHLTCPLLCSARCTSDADDPSTCLWGLQWWLVLVGVEPVVVSGRWTRETSKYSSNSRVSLHLTRNV
jgi:hypothetical protein